MRKFEGIEVVFHFNKEKNHSELSKDNFNICSGTLLEDNQMEGGYFMDNELEEKIGFCPAMVFQEVDVCVPVEIKAFGEAGNAETECIGKPYIDCRCDECHEKHDKECKFTVTQKLKVKVPLIFGARAEVGKAAVDCDCPRGEGCCAKEE